MKKNLLSILLTTLSLLFAEVASSQVFSSLATVPSLTAVYGTASNASPGRRTIFVSNTDGLGTTFTLPLGANITITAPANFEVSNTGSTLDYHPSFSFPVNPSGDITFTVYIRFRSDAPAGPYNGKSITVTSDDPSITTTDFPIANSTVNGRPISINADPKSKIFGDSDPSLTYAITSGSLVSGDVLTGSLSRAVGENIGTYAIDQGTLNNTNYAITYTPANLTITAKPITITADAQTKEYGDADPALTYAITSGSLVLGNPLTGSLTRAVGESIGSYAIGQGTLDNTNYNITYAGNNLTITKRAITITADAKSKTYGDSDPALTYSVTTGTFLPGDSFTGTLTRDPGENAGTYQINQGTVATSSNYDVTYVPANLTISKKAIDVTADVKTKIYGDVDPSLTYTVNVGGLIGGDLLTGSLTRVAGEHVGSYAINQGSLDNSNYAITYHGNNLSITKKDITVTADAKSKSYGSADPALTYSITSGALVIGDALSGALARVVGETLGSYTINQGTLDNTDYNITYASANLTIGPKTINVTADPKSKTYGDVDPALTYSSTPALEVGDSFSGSLSRVAGENVGTHSITQGTLSLSSNYNLVYTPDDLTINKKGITVTADAKTKTYGDVDPALTYTVNVGGLVGADVLTGSLTRAAGEHIGAYAISQGTVDNTNYNITYVGDNLSITKKGITVTADVKTKTYGAVDPALTYTAPGLVGGDVLTGSLSRDPGETVGAYAINQGTLDNSDYTINYVSANLNIGTKTINVTADPKSKTYGDVDPALTYSNTALEFGDSFSGSITRTAGETVGTYAITQGTLSLSSNYNLVYTPDNLTITRKNITVTADPKTKTYGDVDPALTYVVTGGLVPGDVITGTLSRTAGEGVGNHAITQGTVDNTNNPNYNITFAPDNLAITKKPITVTADPQTKVEGTSDPVFTYVVTGSLVGADVLTGALSRAAGETPATYAITQGTLDNANYNITFVADNLTITAAPGGGGGVPGGGGGGLESKSLGDGVGNRMFNRALNSLQGPIDYNKLPVVNAGGMQNRTTGIGTAMSLTDLLPKQISGTGYKVFNSTPTDLTQLTNAKDVLSIDYTSNNQAKAVAFATKTMGEVYDHTKAVCDRLKGSELLSIQNVLVNGVNMVRYDLKNPAGQTEYAMSFSVGAKNGRNNYTIQSNWLNNDYVADEMMFNVQLWAETPALIMSMANDIVSRLKSGMPVTTVVNGNGIPKTYITKGKRESDNIVLNISNSTASTNGYFEVLQKANEQSSVLTKKQVPFTINANATVNAINVPAADNYESTINMYINGVLQDQVFMTDGNWAANVNTSTGTLKSFKVSNDANRVINDKSDFLLFRNVQVEANVPDFVSLYKVLRGGGAPQDLTGYKTFQFTASGAGAGLNITLIKNGVANWADQYSIVLPLSSTPQDYKISLDDFVSTASKDKINPNDITMVIFGLGVGTGKMSAVSADISNASFSKTDVAYLNSLKSTEISVYPNPVIGNTFTANFKAPSVNNLNLQLTDANSGRVVLSKAITSQVGNNNVTVNFDRQPGISTYILTLEGTSIKYTPKKVMMNK